MSAGTTVGPRDDLRRKARASIALVIMMTALVGFTPNVAAASYNNVQVFIATEETIPYSYVVSAYNLSGSMVGSYQSAYPAAGFELPGGDYLFTVSATYQSYVCYVCLDEGTGSTSPETNGSGATEPTSAPTSGPIFFKPPFSEYGYALVHVSSALTLQISTSNVSSLPDYELKVHVAYANGTAAKDSSVSASIVGEWYSWWEPDSKLSMWGQTDSNGSATLVLPKGPAVVTAWSWLSIRVPDNGSVVTTSPDNASGVGTSVGGEKVNVTGYWPLTYLGLSGSALVLPPQSSVNITLQHQDPNYWVMPMGVEAKGAPVAGGVDGTLASQPTGVPSQASGQKSPQGGTSQYYVPTSIPAIPSGAIDALQAHAGAVGFPLATLELIALSIVAVGAALAAVLILARRRARPTASQPA